MSLTVTDFFCGAGGSSQGAAAVPGVTVRMAANHWQLAIDTHATHFPDTEHYRGDLHAADLEGFPHSDIFWASPECTHWSQARGQRREFDKQPDLFGETLPPEAADRSRSLMWDVPRYLAAMKLRGRPVLAGVVENVIEARAGIQWAQWVKAIRDLGYKTRLIALNSMHAQPRVTPRAPQSRDRLYLAYWLASLGRDPDWDRWLRPAAWCPTCEVEVRAVQWWKRPGNDMGRYRTQYLYRCPNVACGGQVVEPGVLPAAAAIDWGLLGTRVGDRAVPLKPKTIARIEAGLRRYARPITLEAAGNTFERRPGVRTWPVDKPLTTQTATVTKALACPPFITVARFGNEATGIDEPLGTLTTGRNHGLATPPFLIPLRSGRDRSIPLSDPLATIVGNGSNHGLVFPPFIAVLRNNQHAHPVTDPLGVVSTSGAHHALIAPPETAIVMRGQSSRGDAGYLSTPVAEPFRTHTASGSQFLIDWGHLLVPYNRTGVARPVSEPAPTVTAVDRCGLAAPAVNVEDVLFRMLEPHEISAAMAFFPTYTVLGNKREKVRQLGNAVTPPVAEVLVSALAEAITGEPFAELAA